MKDVFKYFLFTLFIVTSAAYSQQREVDSLLKIIQTSNTKDTNLIWSVTRLAYAYMLMEKYPDAINNYEKGIVLSQKTGFKSPLKALYANLANTYWHIGNLPSALDAYLNFLKVAEATKDSVMIGSAYHGIALVYQAQENDSAALRNLKLALTLYSKLNFKAGMAKIYNNLGVLYSNQRNYDQSLINHRKALELKKDMGDSISIASSLNNIGLVYRNKNDFKTAKYYYLQTIRMIKYTPDDELSSSVSINLGNTYKHLGKLDSSRYYLNKALRAAFKANFIRDISFAYSSLTELDSLEGNYKDAFKNHRLYIIYRDSLNNEANTRKTVQAQMQYDFDKINIKKKAEQEKKDALALEDKQKQNIITYSIATGLGLVIIFSLFIFKEYRQKQKVNLELAQKNKDIEIQKNIIEEKHKEITDSINYAERIQRSFLATKELLDENLNEYFVLFKPKDIVSGDFYWACQLNNGDFAFATADSTGHGVPGAIMSLLNITSLEKAIETESEPDKILNHTRTTIIERLKKDGSVEGGKDGMDCSLISINKERTKLKIAAAHNPVWVMRPPAIIGSESVAEPVEATVIEIKADKMPVGKHDKQNIPFTLNEITLQPGDVIYTLTDGFPDQFGGPLGKKFMSKNLRELLKNISLKPLSEQKEILDQTFTDWLGNIEQVDDVTIVGIRV